jgi:hypothetical protein
VSRSLRRLASGLAGLSLACGGCGDDGDPVATDSKRPSKQAFIAEADRLCAEASEDYDAVVTSLPPFERLVARNVSRRVMRETGRAAPRMAAIEREIERRLRALDPPAALAARWGRALDTLETRAQAAEDIGAAAQAGDRTAYLTGFGRFERAGSVSSAALRGYGFKVCAAD